MRIIFIVLFLFITIVGKAQTYLDNEESKAVLTEYIDGRYWVYKHIDGFIVGLVCETVSDKYGRYYQLDILIRNLTDENVIFEPERVSAKLIKKWDAPMLKVYTNEAMQKKITRTQNWAMVADALNGYNTGNVSSLINTGILEQDRKLIEAGYLKKHTIHPNEDLVGYMNVKYENGEFLTLYIPIGNSVFSYEWDVSKNSRK